MKKHIKIKFLGFWEDFDENKNIFTKLLKNIYDVEIVPYTYWDNDIDICFYSNIHNQIVSHMTFLFNNDNPKKNKVKIVYYTGENDYPNFNECDYAIGQIDGLSVGRNSNQFNRYFRFPHWMLHLDTNELNFDNLNYDEDLNKYFDRKFCSMVVSNTNYSDPTRLLLKNSISEYKTVEGFGKLFDNPIGPTLKDKINICSQYKFNIAAENSKVCGYVTEKILDAFYMKTVPIYWGDNKVFDDFNENSFINATNFIPHDEFNVNDKAWKKGLKELNEYIQYIDENKEEYLRMLVAPKFNQKPSVWYKQLEEYLKNIVENGHTHNHWFGNMGFRWVCLKSELYKDFVKKYKEIFN